MKDFFKPTKDKIIMTFVMPSYLFLFYDFSISRWDAGWLPIPLVFIIGIAVFLFTKGLENPQINLIMQKIEQEQFANRPDAFFTSFVMIIEFLSPFVFNYILACWFFHWYYHRPEKKEKNNNPTKKSLKQYTFIWLLIFSAAFIPIKTINAADLATRLKGKILLQVESKGEAWYVNPANSKRYYLGRPTDAFELMRELGIGISNADLEKIQIADANLTGTDTDGDGLSDAVEDAIGTDKNKTDTDSDNFSDKDELLNGYNPNGIGNLNIDNNFAGSHLGKIFLQVETNGEAWYINPVDSKRYFLGKPADAFSIMRSLGLGISNTDLEQITALYTSSLFKTMELEIHNLINEQRVENGLDALTWNDEVASVARDHSANLATENEPLTKSKIRCDLPMIHHEGPDFGLYNKDRLKARQIYYLSGSGENIALIPSVESVKYVYTSADKFDSRFDDCTGFASSLNNELKQILEEEASESKKIKIIQEEIVKRKNLVEQQVEINIVEVIERNAQQIDQEAVTGWMNSPGHRANILTANFDETGIGIAQVKNYFIITQVFITRSDCGYQTGPCCEKEGYYPYCYVPLGCEEMVCVEK